MSKAFELKKEIVQEILNKINEAKALIVVEYQGLNVTEMNKLRQILKFENIYMQIYKNRLFKLAIKQTKYLQLNDYLTGANTFVFCQNDDVIKGPKLLANFAKTHKKLKLKAAIYNNEVISQQQLKEIASLPLRDELIAMFAASLTYPLRMFAINLKLIAEQKQTKI